jgi:hypothetical protein
MKNTLKLRSSRNGEMAAAIASVAFAAFFFVLFFMPHPNSKDSWFDALAPFIGIACLWMAWDYLKGYKKIDAEWRKMLPQVKCPSCGRETAVFERPLHIGDIVEQSIHCSCGCKSTRHTKRDPLGNTIANVWN